MRYRLTCHVACLFGCFALRLYLGDISNDNFSGKVTDARTMYVYFCSSHKHNTAHFQAAIQNINNEGCNKWPKGTFYVCLQAVKLNIKVNIE